MLIQENHSGSEWTTQAHPHFMAGKRINGISERDRELSPWEWVVHFSSQRKRIVEKIPTMHWQFGEQMNCVTIFQCAKLSQIQIINFRWWWQCIKIKIFFSFFIRSKANENFFAVACEIEINLSFHFGTRNVEKWWKLSDWKKSTMNAWIDDQKPPSRGKFPTFLALICNENVWTNIVSCI